MVNAWSLLYDELYGDDKMIDEKKKQPDPDGGINLNGSYEFITETGSTESLGCGITIGGFEDGISISTNTDGYEHSEHWYDYTRNDPDMPNPFAVDPLSDNDDQIAHHVDSLSLNTEGQIKGIMSDSRNKYHEKEILEDVEEYVARTYNGHYTGTKHEYRNVQTLDLMAARDLASDFCQANILKYGSRYGSKDGKNKKDLMKVIHYAMLLLHFDEHYGKPSMTSGNIDHTMP